MGEIMRVNAKYRVGCPASSCCTTWPLCWVMPSNERDRRSSIGLVLHISFVIDLQSTADVTILVQVSTPNNVPLPYLVEPTRPSYCTVRRRKQERRLQNKNISKHKTTTVHTKYLLVNYLRFHHDPRFFHNIIHRPKLDTQALIDEISMETCWRIGDPLRSLGIV
jgi:hypothetical protein